MIRDIPLFLGGGLAAFLLAPSLWPVSLVFMGVGVGWWSSLIVTSARQAGRVKALLTSVLKASAAVA
jgi:hypothetical protein